MALGYRGKQCADICIRQVVRDPDVGERDTRLGAGDLLVQRLEHVDDLGTAFRVRVGVLDRLLVGLAHDAEYDPPPRSGFLT